MPVTPPLERHYAPRNFRDRIAYVFVRFLGSSLTLFSST